MQYGTNPMYPLSDYVVTEHKIVKSMDWKDYVKTLSGNDWSLDFARMQILVFKSKPDFEVILDADSIAGGWKIWWRF